MSYCRFGWDGSNVYIIGTTIEGVNKLQCVGCVLAFESNPEWDVWNKENPDAKFFEGPSMFKHNGNPYYFETYHEMLEHLKVHREADHHVPEYVDEELTAEMNLPDGHGDKWVKS